MKRLLIVLALFVAVFTTVSPAFAAVRVRGYTRSNGTYVQPYYRSSPNYYKYDNYSYKGNYNPYTGRLGTKW